MTCNNTFKFVLRLLQIALLGWLTVTALVLVVPLLACAAYVYAKFRQLKQKIFDGQQS